MKKTTEGLLVFNNSYASVEVLSHLDMFVQAFRKYGCELTLTDSLRHGVDEKGQVFISGVNDISEFQFAVFYDKDIFLARALEQTGVRVYNSAKALEICDDKYFTYQYLSGQNIKMPFTVSAPLVYRGNEDIGSGYINFLESAVGYPMIVKENSGSQGRQVYKCDNNEQLRKLRRALLHTPHLYQKFVESSFGTDYRFYYIGGQVLGAVKRTSDNDFRSNVANGGKMELFAADDEWTDTAVCIGKAIGLDFGTVDFLINENGKPVFCEANSNTFFINYYKLCGINFAEKIAEYILHGN